MAGIASQPIGEDELEHLLRPVLAAPIALAVSGGADSMALMHLVARALSRPQFASMLQAPAGWVSVVTVDHQLRPESGAEAAFVKAQADRLGFTHHTLQWHSEKPASGLQAAARAARYALMASAIKDEHASGGPLRSLVTAHHAGDQAETLLMRLARGSGTSGLAAMQGSSAMHGVDLLRPLLGVPKSRLIATLQAIGADWIEDPSNTNEEFERVRVRHALPHLAALGIDDHMLALSARRLARADAALESLTTQLATATGVSHHGGAYASLDSSIFRKGEAEARIRLLGYLIAAHGGQAEGPRLSQLEDLDEHICGTSTNASGTRAATLGGCAVRWDRVAGQLQIFREAGRGLPDVTLVPGQPTIWDRRYRVMLSEGPTAQEICAKAPVVLKALGDDAYATLRLILTREIPALAGAALPAFFQNGHVIAVPYFSDQVPHLAGPNEGAHCVCAVEALIPGIRRQNVPFRN